MSAVEEFNETYEEFRKTYDECLALIAEGLELEISNEEAAVIAYKDAIALMDKTMLLPIIWMSYGNDPDKMNDLKRMIYNLKMQRSEILLRIGTIYHGTVHHFGEESSSKVLQKPNSFMGALADLEKVLKELGKVQSAGIKNNLIEILFWCDGVKLYHISNDGEVVSSLEDFTLRIVRLGGSFGKNLDETIFLQLIKSAHSTVVIGSEIGPGVDNVHDDFGSQEDTSIIYPLIPGVSPCFRTEFNAYILPDLHTAEGSTIGLIIPPQYDTTVLDILIEILKGVVKADGHIEFGKSSTGDMIADKIESAATWISHGLEKTAQKTIELIDHSAPYTARIMSKFHKAPADDPQSTEEGDGCTSVVLHESGYDQATQSAAFVAEKVLLSMQNLVKYLAPHVHEQSDKLAKTGKTLVEEAKPEILKIAHGTAEALSTIYHGLESSASILRNNLSNNSVKAIEYKIEEPVEVKTECTFDTVGNLYNATRVDGDANDGEGWPIKIAE